MSEILAHRETTFQLSTIIGTLPMIVGGGVLVTGLLKLGAFSGDLASQYFYFFHPIIFTILVLVEIGLGCWILAIPLTRSTVLACSLVFGILSVAAISGTVTGTPNCGCLGVIPTPPKFMAGIDLAILLVCALIYRQIPAKTNSRTLANTKSHGMRWILACSAIGVVAFNLGQASNEMLSSGIRVLPKSLNLGSMVADRQEKRTLLVKNTTHESIKIIGSQSTCACGFPELPKTIKSGETARIPILIKAPGASENREFLRQITFWTDHPSKPQVTQRIFGWIEPANKTN